MNWENRSGKERHEWNKMCVDYGLKNFIMPSLYKKPRRKRRGGRGRKNNLLGGGW